MLTRKATFTHSWAHVTFEIASCGTVTVCARYKDGAGAGFGETTIDAVRSGQRIVDLESMEGFDDSFPLTQPEVDWILAVL